MNTPLRKVLIGETKYHPRKQLTPQTRNEDGSWEQAVYSPAWNEFVPPADGRTGILHGFFEERDSDEGCVVGLVENPDGTFDTFIVNRLKFITPTEL